MFICASAVASTAAAAAAPPPIAQPTGKWVVEFEHERCTAARAYSDGVTQFVLGFQPRPTLDLIEVIVAAPTAVHGMAFWNAQVWAGGNQRIDTTAIATTSAKPGASRYGMDVERKIFALLLRNPDLRIDSDQGPRVHVRLTDFPEVTETLKECEAGLLAEWGLSREMQESLANFPKPKASLYAYFGDYDYPTKAGNRGAEGTVEARVTVNIDGKPTDCHIMRTSGHKELDDATCVNFVKRARFEPARDKSGKPVVSPYVFRFSWYVG